MSFAVSVLLGIGGLFAIAAALRAVARATLPEAARSIANDIPLTAAFGILVIVIYAAVAIAAPVLAPFAEREIVGNQFEAWSSEHLLGTDRIGRDMLSRLTGRATRLASPLPPRRWPLSWARSSAFGRR